MLKKCLAVLLSAASVFCIFAGCSRGADISSGAGEKDFPVTIGDITLRNEPSGVAVLSPNIADIILGMGSDYEICLKAKSASCTQSDLSALPNVTAGDADRIKSLGASLVFTDSALTDAQQSAMEKDGITVLTLKSASSRSDLSRLYSEVGSALKGAKTGYEKGKSSASSVLETIDDITRMVPQNDKPVTVVYLYSLEGKAATGDTLAGSLIQAAGLLNSAESGQGSSFSMKELLLADPQYIFCPKGLKAKIQSSDSCQKLSAVKNGKIYEMDPSFMELQGGRMVDAVSFMAGTVYPELLKSVPADGTSSGTESTSPAVSSSVLNLDQTLKKGMKSDDVLKMQNRLDKLGYMFLKPTGLYAGGTEQAVKDFQYLNGMTVTGVADPATLKKMFSSDVKQKKNS